MRDGKHSVLHPQSRSWPGIIFFSSLRSDFFFVFDLFIIIIIINYIDFDTAEAYRERQVGRGHGEERQEPHGESCRGYSLIPGTFY